MGAEEPPRSDLPSDAAPATSDPPAPAPVSSGGARGNMLPKRGRRRYGIERLLVRLIATFGIIGVGVALGAILAASKVQGWIIGLVVAGVSVILAGLLWSSRQL
jgi:hypothetical protein